MKTFPSILLVALVCTSHGCRENPKPAAPVQALVPSAMARTPPPSPPPTSIVSELPPELPQHAHKRLGSNALRTHGVTRLAITPDGNYIATLNVNEDLEVWRVDTGRRVWMRDKDKGGKGQTLAFSSDGKLLGTGGESDVRFFHTNTGERAHKDFFLPSYIASVAFSPDGQYFAATTIKSIADVMRGRPPSFNPLAPSAEQKERYKLSLWRTDSLEGEPIWVVPGVHGIDDALRFSPDSAHIAVGTLAERVEVFDVTSGQRVHDYAKHGLEVASLAYSNSSELMVSASRSWLRPDYKGEVNLWDLATGKLRHQWQSTDMHLVEFAGNRMVGAGTQGVVRMWQLTPTIEQLPVVAWHKYWVTTLAIASKAEVGASADKGGAIHLWNTRTGKALGRGDAHEGSVMSLHFSANGETLISLGGDGAIRTWNVASGRSKKVIVPFERKVPGLIGHSVGNIRLGPYGNELRVGLLSEDENKLYVAGQLGVAIVDLNSGRLVCQNENIAVMDGGAQILRVGSALVTASEHNVTLWDPKDCFTLRELEPGGEVVTLLKGDSQNQLRAVIWDKNYTPSLTRWDLNTKKQTLSTVLPDDTTLGYWQVGQDKLMTQEARGARQLHFLDEKTGKAVEFIEENWPRSLGGTAVAHDNTFAIAFAGREIRLIDLHNKTSTPFATSDGYILSAAISNDDCMLATGGMDSSILLWKLPGANCSKDNEPLEGGKSELN